MKYFLLFALLSVTNWIFPQADRAAAKQIVVGTNEEIYKAVNLLNPGDELLLSDGVYSNLKLIIQRSGNAGMPIKVRAKNPGNVFISGDSKVEMRGEHLILEGFYFKDGNRNPKEWRTHGPGLVAIYGSYNRVTACVFDFFDKANSAYITTSLTEDGKVPTHCRIDHCVFTDKITFDQVINLNNTASAIKDGSKGGPAMYHRVDHNFFSNPKKPGNAGGGIRIGYYRNDLGRCLIDSNLFMRQDSEAEIITSKSRENVFYNNTVINSQGTLNFRHGDKQVAINNFFIGTDKKYGYGGMFVWGSDHIIASNYFELPTTIKSRGNAALYLNPGPADSEHALVFNSMIINNAFININGHAIHFNPLEERRREFSKAANLFFEIPHTLTIKGNLFHTTTDSAYPFFKADHPGRNNTWEDNIVSNSNVGIPFNSGLELKALPLKRGKTGIYTPGDTSRFGFAKPVRVQNIEGIDLDLSALINAGIVGKPLTWGDVRPVWLKDIPGTYFRAGKLSADRQKKFDEVTNQRP